MQRVSKGEGELEKEGEVTQCGRPGVNIEGKTFSFPNLCHHSSIGATGIMYSGSSILAGYASLLF